MPILVLDLGGVLVRLDDARLRPVLRPELGARGSAPGARLPECLYATLLSWQLGAAKPDPEIWRLAEARLQARPGDIVFVDDNPINLASARRAGWRALHARGSDEAARVLSGGIE